MDKLHKDIGRNGEWTRGEVEHQRERWWQEDRLIDQRLTWLLTSQSLLFAALAWLIPLRSNEDLWIYLIILTGLSIAVVIRFGIKAAKSAQDELDSYCPPVRAGLTETSRKHGSIAAEYLPDIFIAAWIMSLIYLVTDSHATPTAVYQFPKHNLSGVTLVCRSNKIADCFEYAGSSCVKLSKLLVWVDKDGDERLTPDFVQVTERESIVSYRCK